MNQKVLQKLLKKDSETEALQSYLRPEKEVVKKLTKKPGRPKVAAEMKARNFTLCLAQSYVKFLDHMVVKDKKIQGRGRKIRFIIDRFLEHEKRSLAQLKVLRKGLVQLDEVLKSFAGRVKKGQKLELTRREKDEISRAVNEVHLLLNILAYAPKTLRERLPKDEWALISFSLDWKSRRGVTL